MKRLSAAVAAVLLTVGLTAGCTFDPPQDPCPTTMVTVTATETPKPVTYKVLKPAPTKTVTARPRNRDDHYCGDD